MSEKLSTLQNVKLPSEASHSVTGKCLNKKSGHEKMKSRRPITTISKPNNNKHNMLALLHYIKDGKGIMKFDYQKNKIDLNNRYRKNHRPLWVDEKTIVIHLKNRNRKNHPNVESHPVTDPLGETRNHVTKQKSLSPPNLNTIIIHNMVIF